MRTEVIDSDQSATVARAASGDPLAFAEIVAQFHDDLSRIGFAISGDVEIGRDAAQAAWETAWRRLPTLRDQTKLRSWLLVIAANEARRMSRRRRLRSLLELRALPPVTQDRVEDSAGEIDLARAMQRMNSRDRHLLAMRFSLGMTSDEIGEALSLSPSGVRTQIARLLGRLRKELSDG